MDWWAKLGKRDFFIKLKSWEYWPFGIVQFPLFFYYPWLSLKARSFTFFSASNPGILMGGMFGESKYEVLKMIPSALVPKTVLIKANADFQTVLRLVEQERLQFPLIFKPDIGERGFMVKRINSPGEVKRYLDEMKFDFLIQELVDLPFEFGVFYSRLPSQEKGKVTSIVMKEMLSVTGNGKASLKELIWENERAKLQWPVLQKRYAEQLDTILSPGQTLEIVSIGNHCLGTKFLNANHLITPALSDAFDAIARSIPGFYFGRFDLRCASIDALTKGEVIVLELNGCGAEPAHIYDPSFSFWKAVQVLINHWKTIYHIARENELRGASYLPLREAIQHYQNFKDKTKTE